MIRLTNFRIYTCGHIENDYGNDWRGDLTHKLHGVEPSFVVWDPMIKPTWMSLDSRNDSLSFDKKLFYESTEPVTYLDRCRMLQANTECRRVCRKLVNQCDIVIARLCNKFTWGSIDELELAIERGIPIFLWFPDGPLGLYGTPGIIDKPEFVQEYIHYSQESLIAKIRDIHSGRCDLPERNPERWLPLTYTGRK